VTADDTGCKPRQGSAQPGFPATCGLYIAFEQQNSRAAATEKTSQTCYTTRAQFDRRDLATAVPN